VSLLRFIGAAVVRAARNLAEQRRLHLLSLTVMALSLSVLGIFLVIAANLATARSQLGGERVLTAFIAVASDDTARERLRAEAARLPGVAGVELRSASQTAARFRATLGPQGAILDDLGEEVIPAALEVTATDELPADALDQLAGTLGALIGVEEVVYAAEELRRFTAVVRVIEAAALAIGGLIALVVIIIISNTIRLTVMARQEEIAILKLVGATDMYVRLPFVLEGLFGGLFAGTTAAALVWSANAALVESLRALSLGGFDAAMLATLAPQQVGLLILGGGGLGLLGGLVSVGRFLRVS